MERMEYLIVIPAHRPKINWLVSFLNSVALHAVPSEAKILVIASDRNDHHYFTQALSHHRLAANLLFLDAEAWIRDNLGSDALVERLRQNTDRCAINLKKFVGLSWALQNGVETTICLDSDTLAVAGLARIHEVARGNHEEALYIGGSIGRAPNRDLLAGIVRESATLFAPAARLEIAARTNGHTLYTWFADMPVYGAEHLRGFFACMEATHGSLALFLAALRWETFDHLLYMFYRVCFHGARIFDCHKELGIGAIPELLTPRELFQIGTATGYDVGWMSAGKAYDHPEAFRILPNLSLLSHFDRF